MEWETNLVLEIGISTMGQQEGTQLSSPFLCSFMEGGEAPPVSGINRRLEPDE